MTLPSLFRAHVAARPAPVTLWMPRAAARAMTLLTTPPATLSNTFVPAARLSARLTSLSVTLFTPSLTCLFDTRPSGAPAAGLTLGLEFE